MTAKIFQVGPNQVRVRSAPGLQGEMIRWLDPGTQLEVNPQSRTVADDHIWWQHAEGWTAEQHISGSPVYLFEAVPAPTPSAPDKKLFRAGSFPVRVRSEPHLRGATLSWVQPGDILEVSIGSRIEADGQVWWHHVAGWSAERSINGAQVYMIDVPPRPSIAPVPATPAPIPVPPAPVPAPTRPVESQPPPPKKSFRVGSLKLRARRDPNLRGETLTWIDPGTLLEVDGGSRTEADGYIWWRHNIGWSAECNLAGSEIYLVDPDVRVDLPASRGDVTPTLDSLPMRNALFERLPMALTQTLWWQYFGNNVYARRIWLQGNQSYKYAQSLHGGLDFGNSRDRGIQVVAGVTGSFKFHDRVYTRPHGLWVKVGDYTVIYGHLANPRLFRVGELIRPETILGELEYGGQNHLHLEVRYKDRWIINPLLLMPEAMRANVIGKFPPSDDYFFRSANWTQWQAPLDQPIITLGGPIIGPNAG
jgi:hypothetical protein